MGDAPSQNKDGSVVPASPSGPSGLHSHCVPKSFLIPGEHISSDSRSPGREVGLGLGLLQTLQGPLLRLKGREGLTLGALGLASLPLLQSYVLCPSTCLPDPFALSWMCCTSLFLYLFALASPSCLEGISWPCSPALVPTHPEPHLWNYCNGHWKSHLRLVLTPRNSGSCNPETHTIKHRFTVREDGRQRFDARKRCRELAVV